jgi:hypothetical protein
MLVIERDLMCLSSLVDMAKDLALEIDVHGLSLSLCDMRDAVHIVQHCPILVDCVQGTLHQLASFQKKVDVVSKYLLSMTVPLDLEHELPPCHPVSNLKSFVQNLAFSI